MSRRRAAATAGACTVPVFRFGLDRWREQVFNHGLLRGYVEVGKELPTAGHCGNSAQCDIGLAVGGIEYPLRHP